MLVPLTLLDELQVLGLVCDHLEHILVTKHGSSCLVELSDELLVLHNHILSLLLRHAVGLLRDEVGVVGLQLDVLIKQVLVLAIGSLLLLLQLVVAGLSLAHHVPLLRDLLLHVALASLKLRDAVPHLDLLRLGAGHADVFI